MCCLVIIVVISLEFAFLSASFLNIHINECLERHCSETWILDIWIFSFALDN